MLDKETLVQLRVLLWSNSIETRTKAMGHLLSLLRKHLTKEDIQYIVKRNQ